MVLLSGILLAHSLACEVAHGPYPQGLEFSSQCQTRLVALSVREWSSLSTPALVSTQTGSPTLVCNNPFCLRYGREPCNSGNGSSAPAGTLGVYPCREHMQPLLTGPLLNDTVALGLGSFRKLQPWLVSMSCTPTEPVQQSLEGSWEQHCVVP